MCTFSMFFVIEIPSLISRFRRQTIIRALFTISLIIFHRTVVLVSIWIFDSTIYELVVFKFTLKLCSILQL